MCHYLQGIDSTHAHVYIFVQSIKRETKDTMATNLQIDDKLISQAVKLGHHRSKKDAVTQALKDYILHIEQENILSLFGSVDYEADYDYKEQRARG